MIEFIANSPKGFIFLIFIGLFFYFLPVAIANGRHNRNTQAILVLNILLGWTYIGWVVAMVWAVYNERIQSDEPAA